MKEVRKFHHVANPTSLSTELPLHCSGPYCAVITLVWNYLFPAAGKDYHAAFKELNGVFSSTICLVVSLVLPGELKVESPFKISPRPRSPVHWVLRQNLQFSASFLWLLKLPPSTEWTSVAHCILTLWGENLEGGLIFHPSLCEKGQAPWNRTFPLDYRENAKMPSSRSLSKVRMSNSWSNFSRGEILVLHGTPLRPVPHCPEEACASTSAAQEPQIFAVVSSLPQICQGRS